MSGAQIADGAQVLTSKVSLLLLWAMERGGSSPLPRRTYPRRVHRDLWTRSGRREPREKGFQTRLHLTWLHLTWPAGGCRTPPPPQAKGPDSSFWGGGFLAKGPKFLPSEDGGGRHW